ncbi:MAG: glycosyltransferase [Rheinheimera sp.]|nr:glycosyltransferase [Rheinheimera sp.]
MLWLQFIWRYVLSFRRFDILHVHYYYPTIWLAWTYKLLRNPKAKIVVTCHGSDIYLYKPESKLYKFAASAVDFFVFTSESLREKFFDQNVQSMVLPAGIHPTFATSQQLSLPEKAIDVLFVGTLDHNKGVDRLLKLVAALPQSEVCGGWPWADATAIGRGRCAMSESSTPILTIANWLEELF